MTVAATATALLLLSLPGIALGAVDWTITRSPSSMQVLSTASFSLVVTNAGSANKASAVGCVIVAVPSSFTVNSAAVTNASGHSWSASYSSSGGPGTTVTVRASAPTERLTGSAIESVSFVINVAAGAGAGPHTWTANAFNGHGCTGSYGEPILLTVTTTQQPAPTPVPTAMPTPVATPAPSVAGVSPRPTVVVTPGSPDEVTGSGSPTPESSTTASQVAGQTPGPGASGTPALSLGGSPDEPFAPLSFDFAFFGMQFDWFIPGLAIAGPGLLVILAIALQMLGALAWLPAVRRLLGDSGSRRVRRAR